MPGWVPAWVTSIDTAVWIADPEGRIGYLNRKAERLLSAGTDAVGSACWEVVAGRDELDRHVCTDDCVVRRRAAEGTPVAPLKLRVGPDGGDARFALLQTIAETAPDGTGPWIIHLAQDIERCQRMDGYLRRVASRNPGPSRPLRETLTRREQQVLRLLADDLAATEIAEKLDIRYPTVRNHIQNLLAKLGAHSILEAIALYLIRDESMDDTPN